MLCLSATLLEPAVRPSTCQIGQVHARRAGRRQVVGVARRAASVHASPAHAARAAVLLGHQRGARLAVWETTPCDDRRRPHWLAFGCRCAQELFGTDDSSGIQAVPVLYTNEGGTLRACTGMALGMLVRLAECVYDEVHRVSSGLARGTTIESITMTKMQFRCPRAAVPASGVPGA